MFEKLGALPWLNWLFSLLPAWDLEFWGIRPLQYGAVLISTLGVMFTLALLIENRWPKITRQYRSVKYGDPALAVTFCVGMVVINLLPDPQWAWYRDSWFHYGLLAVGVIMSFILKWQELRETRTKRKLHKQLGRTEPLTEWLNTYHSADVLHQMDEDNGYSTYAAKTLIPSLKYGVAYSRRQHWSATAIGHMLLVPVAFYLVGLVVTGAFTSIVVNGPGTQWIFWGTVGVLALLASLSAWMVRRYGRVLGVVMVAVILMALMALTILVKGKAVIDLAHSLADPSVYLYAAAAFVMLLGIFVWLRAGWLDNNRRRPNLQDIHPDTGWFPKVRQAFGWFIGLFHKDTPKEEPEDHGSLLDEFAPDEDGPHLPPVPPSTRVSSPVNTDQLVPGGARQRQEVSEKPVSRPSMTRTYVPSVLPKEPLAEITQPEPKPAPPAHVSASEPPQQVTLIDATNAATKTQVVDAGKIAALDPRNSGGTGARLNLGHSAVSQQAPNTSDNAGSNGARLNLRPAGSPAAAPSTTGSNGARLNLGQKTTERQSEQTSDNDDTSSNGARLDLRRR